MPYTGHNTPPSPETIFSDTLESWQRIADGYPDVLRWGWCEFSAYFTGDRRKDCSLCPIKRVMHVCQLNELAWEMQRLRRDWNTKGIMRLAQRGADLLNEHRADIIEEARRMLTMRGKILDGAGERLRRRGADDLLKLFMCISNLGHT